MVETGHKEGKITSRSSDAATDRFLLPVIATNLRRFDLTPWWAIANRDVFTADAELHKPFWRKVNVIWQRSAVEKNLRSVLRGG